jgi:hypothetical protein
MVVLYMSSTESEYIGLCYAGQHLAWLRTFFEDIGHPQQAPSDLKCDNQAAIILTRDAQFRAWTKHIQRKYHFRDDLVGTKQAVIRFVPTGDMLHEVAAARKALEVHQSHGTQAVHEWECQEWLALAKRLD